MFVQLLQAFLLVFSVLSTTSGMASSNSPSFHSPPAPPNSASFSLVLSMLGNMLKSQLKTSKDEFEACPQLWSKTKQQEKQNIFGSADEILHLCRIENSSNNSQQFSTSICQGAMGITGYVCKAIKSADYPASQSLIPMMTDMEKISQVEGLCEALGNVPFQRNLCKIVESRLTIQQFPDTLKKPLDDICNNLPYQQFPTLCFHSCSGNVNQRACQIILQSLRIIIFLETLKEDRVSNPDGDSDPPTRPEITKISEKNEPMTNFSRSLTGPLIQSLLPNNSVQPKPILSATEYSPTLEKATSNQNVVSSKDSNNTTSTSKSSSTETVTTVLNQPMATNVQPAVSSSSSSTKPEPADNVPTKKDSTVSNSISTKTPAGQNSFVESKTTNEDAAEDEPPEPSEPEDDLTIDDETQKAEADPNLDEEDNAEKDMEKPVEVQNTVQEKPSKPDQSYDSQSEIDEDPTNTHFLFYFMFFVVISVTCYVVYQRRNRIIAFVIEGRSGHSSRRRGSSSRERPSSGSYRKLNNLEDAISSQSIKNSNVIY